MAAAVEGLTLLGDWLKWIVEKTAMPILIWFLAFRVAKKNEARQNVAARKVKRVQDRREADELSVRLHEEFRIRWQNMEEYWTQQNKELRVEVADCRKDIELSRKREDECEAREDALQKKLYRFQRWANSMVTAWNIQFPDRPMELPNINGNGS